MALVNHEIIVVEDSADSCIRDVPAGRNVCSPIVVNDDPVVIDVEDEKPKGAPSCSSSTFCQIEINDDEENTWWGVLTLKSLAKKSLDGLKAFFTVSRNCYQCTRCKSPCYASSLDAYTSRGLKKNKTFNSCTQQCQSCSKQHRPCPCQSQILLDILSELRTLSATLEVPHQHEVLKSFGFVPAAKSSSSKSSKAKKTKKPGGVGYGGNINERTTIQTSSGWEAPVRVSLQNLSTKFKAACLASNSTQAASVVDAPPIPLFALVGYSCLIPVLKTLLGASLNAMGHSPALYTSALNIVQSFAACPVLKSLLVTSDNIDELPSLAVSAVDQHTILGLLRAAREQADAFLKHEKGSDSSALKILSVLIRDVETAASAAANNSRVRLRKRKREETEECREERLRRRAEKRFTNSLSPYMFATVEKIGGYCLSAIKGGPKHRMSRLVAELSSLRGSLPMSRNSSIFVVAQEDRMDMIRALISGPPDTPYENGLFAFDILLPASYPDVPPKVKFLTTGGGRTRFNPNLYADGKVCLSLLGTWSGPGWDPKTSTLLQVLVSIQSMILVPDPIFNEPGYQSMEGTAQGDKLTAAYNMSRMHATAQLALVGMLNNPPDGFEEVVKLYMTLKSGDILQQCEKWRGLAASYTEDGSGYSCQGAVTEGGLSAMVSADQLPLILDTLRQKVMNLPPAAVSGTAS